MVKALRYAVDAAEVHGHQELLRAMVPLLEIHCLALQLAEAEHAHVMQQLSDVRQVQMVVDICRQPASIQCLSREDIDGLVHNAVRQNPGQLVMRKTHMMLWQYCSMHWTQTSTVKIQTCCSARAV